MYEFIKAYRRNNPNANQEDAIGAAEINFDCPRSTVQRHMAPLEKAEPALRKVGELLRRLTEVKPDASTTAGFDFAPYKGLTRRLAVFYSPDEMAELRTLKAPIALKIAEEREELESLRAAHKRIRKKSAR